MIWESTLVIPPIAAADQRATKFNEINDRLKLDGHLVTSTHPEWKGWSPNCSCRAGTTVLEYSFHQSRRKLGCAAASETFPEIRVDLGSYV